MKKLLFILLFIVSCTKPQTPSNVIDTIVNSKIDSSYVVTYSDFVITEFWIQNYYKITVAEDGIYPLQFIEGKYEIVVDNGEIIKEKSKDVNTFTKEELDKLILYLKNNGKK